LLPTIYNLTLANIQDEFYFNELIAKNMTNDYYWSRDWSVAFYVALAKKGFISTTHDSKEGLLLLPEMQFHYGILDFKNLHISKKVTKLIKKNDATLYFNTQFNEVIEQLNLQHKNNWLKNEYAELLQKIYKEQNKIKNFKIISVELISKTNQELIAGEIGYVIGSTYTSLSGFSLKEKKYNNYGKLQLVLLAKHLENSGFSFWNLGHPHMEYKQKLGSITHTREEFLKRWEEATQSKNIEHKNSIITKK